MQKIASNPIRKFTFIIILMLINLRQTFNMLNLGTEWITLFILIISVLSISFKQSKLSLLSLFIGFILLVIQPQSFIFVQILLIVTSYSFLSVKKIAKYNLMVQLIFFSFNLFLLESGIIDENVSTDYKKGTTDLGYGNINTFSAYIYFILLSLYLYFYKFKIIYPIIFIISYIVYSLSGGRTYFVAEILLLITSCNMFLKHSISKYTLLVLPVAIVFLIIYFIYDFSLGNVAIDILLSGRLRYTFNLFSSMSLKELLFGCIQDDELVIDIAFVKMIVIGGVTSLLYFLFIYYKSYNQLSIKQQYIPIIISLLLAGISESVFSHISFSGGLFIWFILYKNACEIKKTKC